MTFDVQQKVSLSYIMSTIQRPCHTRVTNKNCKYFADGIHKFYLEYCCMNPCIEGQTCCKSCIKIHKGARSQFDSTYPHGHMSEPIPAHSHIFGGTWYEERIKDWGEPSAEVIALALQHQVEARQFYMIPTLSKESILSTSHDMGRPKKVVEPIKDVPEKPVIEKRSRKPKVGIITVLEPVVESAVESAVETKPKPKAKPRNKTVKPKEEVKKLEVQPICKEVVIPEYIEENIEEIDIQQYETEYIILTPIEIDKITYWHDTKKQKLYEIIKNKQIGPYIGRYCPNTALICTDVPDSDEEKDE